MLRNLVLMLFAALVIAGPAAAADPKGVDPESLNPLLGLKFFVDRDSPSWLQWQAYQRAGDTARADLVWKIAREPRNMWLGRFTHPNFEVKVRRRIDAAKADGSIPLLTVLRAQSIGCSPTYQGGGPAEDAATRRWYDDLARVIGGDRVLIAFEPDSLGTIDCHAKSRRDDRIELLRYGVDALSELPNATIYLEGGASDWESAERTAKQLRAIGIAKVRGFMLNATHFDWTSANVKHGLELSRLTGGKHFIINTAENGRGPVSYKAANGRRINVWCNPGLRGLGPAPTTDTSHPKVDAYLWVNRPGYGQSCAGQQISWDAPRALTYARHATDWQSPAPGTRFGHAKRYPLSEFGIPR